MFSMHFERMIIMDSFDIQIKKILLAGLYRKSSSDSPIIVEIIRNLLFLSQNSASNIYITDAAQYIFAYLQLGFGYLEYQSLFDHVLQKAGIPTNYIKELQKTNPYVTLNKDRLRSIIGRWPASPYNSHTITQVVNEIISHVENNDLGEYNYYTAKKDGSYTALYRLAISADSAILNDGFNNKFYRLIKK